MKWIWICIVAALAGVSCTDKSQPVVKGPDPVKELGTWVLTVFDDKVSIHDVAKGADPRELARAWSAPGTTSNERLGIAAWLLVKGGDAFPQDLWLDRLLETNRVRSGVRIDDAWTWLPAVLEAVYLETKDHVFLGALIESQMDGAPAELQGYSLIKVFLAEPERLDPLFAPADSRPGAKALRWAITTELDSPDSETAKALVALRDRQDLPNFRAFLSRLEATQKQGESRRK